MRFDIDLSIREWHDISRMREIKRDWYNINNLGFPISIGHCKISFIPLLFLYQVSWRNLRDKKGCEKSALTAPELDIKMDYHC